jgi:hypothetical protein
MLFVVLYTLGQLWKSSRFLRSEYVESFCHFCSRDFVERIQPLIIDTVVIMILL